MAKSTSECRKDCEVYEKWQILAGDNAGLVAENTRLKELETELLDANLILVCKCGWYGKVEDQDAAGTECGCCPDCGNEDLIWLSELQERIKELEADYADLKEIQATDYNHAVRNAERIKELEAENKKLKALKCPPIESGDTCICLIEELEAENDKFKDALVRIDNWAKAYPLVAFPKPDLKKAAMVLNAAGMTLDAISADAMRHVLDGVKDITGKALKGN